VADTVVVAVVDGLEYLLENNSCVVLTEVFLLYDSLEQLSSAAYSMEEGWELR
jgi:hypothetical protein